MFKTEVNMPYKLSGTYFAKRISTAKTFDDVQLAVKAYNDFLMARWLYYTDFFKSDNRKWYASLS